MNVLFVCLGNICRSPIAEGILKKMFVDNGIEGRVESAGFETYLINDSPDARAIKVTSQNGIDISDKKVRLFNETDFENFDLIYVMDTKNMQDVRDLTTQAEHLAKVDYIMNLLEPGKNLPLVDPYQSGISECENVFSIIYKACQKITLQALQKEIVE